eukprot:368217-Rhodomonas_salina.4
MVSLKSKSNFKSKGRKRSALARFWPWIALGMVGLVYYYMIPDSVYESLLGGIISAVASRGAAFFRAIVGVLSSVPQFDSSDLNPHLELCDWQEAHRGGRNLLRRVWSAWNACHPTSGPRKTSPHGRTAKRGQDSM